MSGHPNAGSFLSIRSAGDAPITLHPRLGRAHGGGAVRRENPRRSGLHLHRRGLDFHLDGLLHHNGLLHHDRLGHHDCPRLANLRRGRRRGERERKADHAMTPHPRPEPDRAPPRRDAYSPSPTRSAGRIITETRRGRWRIPPASMWRTRLNTRRNTCHEEKTQNALFHANSFLFTLPQGYQTRPLPFNSIKGKKCQTRPSPSPFAITPYPSKHSPHFSSKSPHPTPRNRVRGLSAPRSGQSRCGGRGIPVAGRSGGEPSLGCLCVKFEGNARRTDLDRGAETPVFGFTFAPSPPPTLPIFATSPTPSSPYREKDANRPSKTQALMQTRPRASQKSPRNRV